MRYRRVTALLLTVALAVGLGACAAFTFGKDFPSPAQGAIKNGSTTKADLERMFGKPAEVGVSDGNATWTWYYGKKGNPDLSKRLDITFDAAGVVKSHSFSSNFPEDMKTVR